MRGARRAEGANVSPEKACPLGGVENASRSGRVRRSVLAEAERREELRRGGCGALTADREGHRPGPERRPVRRYLAAHAVLPRADLLIPGLLQLQHLSRRKHPDLKNGWHGLTLEPPPHHRSSPRHGEVEDDRPSLEVELDRPRGGIRDPQGDRHRRTHRDPRRNHDLHPHRIRLPSGGRGQPEQDEPRQNVVSAPSSVSMFEIGLKM